MMYTDDIVYGFGGWDDNKWCEAEDIEMHELDDLMEEAERQYDATYPDND